MTSPPAGWYSDPQNPAASQRFWDGAGWTQQVQPTAMFPPPNLAPGGFQTGYPTFSPSGPVPTGGNTLLARNKLTAITVALCVAYAIVAIYGHFVFIGILPVVMTIRAFRSREPLAGVAALATVVSIGISIVSLTN